MHLDYLKLLLLFIFCFDILFLSTTLFRPCCLFVLFTAAATATSIGSLIQKINFQQKLLEEKV